MVFNDILDKVLSLCYVKIILFYMKEMGHTTLSFWYKYFCKNLNYLGTLNLYKVDKVAI